MQCHRPGTLVLCSGQSLQGLVQTTPSVGLKVKALNPLHEENYLVSRLEKLYGPLSYAGLLTQVLEWGAGGPGGPDSCP